jgi:hypothetical protein
MYPPLPFRRGTDTIVRVSPICSTACRSVQGSALRPVPAQSPEQVLMPVPELLLAMPPLQAPLLPLQVPQQVLLQAP